MLLFIKDDLVNEAKRLENMDIKILYSSNLTKEFFESEKDNFDIIATSRSFLDMCFPNDIPNKKTLLTPISNILSSQDSNPSVLQSIFDARRAGVSADRISQGLDPASSRGEEGSRESRLYTNMNGYTIKSNL